MFLHILQFNDFKYSRGFFDKSIQFFREFIPLSSHAASNPTCGRPSRPDFYTPTSRGRIFRFRLAGHVLIQQDPWAYKMAYTYANPDNLYLFFLAYKIILYAN